MAKLDELNKQLTSAESERMDKEALYRLVESGDPDAIASSAGSIEDSGPVHNRLRNYWIRCAASRRTSRFRRPT